MKAMFKRLDTSQDVCIRTAAHVWAQPDGVPFTPGQIWHRVKDSHAFAINLKSAQQSVYKALRRMATAALIKEIGRGHIRQYSRPVWHPIHFNQACKAATGALE